MTASRSLSAATYLDQPNRDGGRGQASADHERRARRVGAMALGVPGACLPGAPCPYPLNFSFDAWDMGT
jgi:hypothetical protein